MLFNSYEFLFFFLPLVLAVYYALPFRARSLWLTVASYVFYAPGKEETMPTTMLEAVKIQARVLIPVVKALEAELGKQKAHALVGRAIAESWADFVASRHPRRNEHPEAAGTGFEFPVQTEVVERAEDAFGLDFTACAFADYFREIGEPEIGALLTCGVDFAVERRLRPDWEFRRTQTRMQGAPSCDFRWRRRRTASGSGSAE